MNAAHANPESAKRTEHHTGLSAFGVLTMELSHKLRFLQFPKKSVSQGVAIVCAVCFRRKLFAGGEEHPSCDSPTERRLFLSVYSQVLSNY